MSTAELSTDKQTAYAEFAKTWTTLLAFGAQPTIDMKSAWQIWWIAWSVCAEKREAGGV